MSRWAANNPELYDELATRALPDPWREKVESGEIEIRDVPEDIQQQAYTDGEVDYWDGLASQAEYHPSNDPFK